MVLFDTSVLVAGLVAAHPHHAPAFAWLTRARAGEVRGVIAVHDLAELYAVLTTMPLRPRPTPSDIGRVIHRDITPNFSLITLSARDYRAMIGTLAVAGMTGGVVYDAVAVASAVKAGAERVVTLNRRDFVRLGREFGVTVDVIA